MAPVGQSVQPHGIDRTPEYEDFMARLRDYHEKRGTVLDPEPKVGTNTLDLLKVFNHIVEAGGYDKVSEEKLAWRRMAQELALVSTNEASTAFALKEKFYKNLAAFEISTVHGKEPPPKDILEDVTAKGAGLLTRTRENFRPRRDTALDSGHGSGDDGTPVRERPAMDFGTSARATRGLREAPAQRVIFQPDTGPSRNTPSKHGQQPQMHHGAGTPASNMHMQGPPPHYGGQQPPPRGPSVVHHPQNQDNMSSMVTAYQPRHHKPLQLRAVATPSNAPQSFPKPSWRQQNQPKQPIPPGTGVDGPNIYMRCLNALRSGMPREQAFALNHLVKISYERGDKYRFDAFAGLSEGLVEKALEVGSIYYHVNWSISWDDVSSGDISALDGNYGTPDLIERIESLIEKDVPDSLQTEAIQDQMTLITEAVLTIRNMVSALSDNARYMSDFPPIKDLICIILHLPQKDSLVELKHCALDIAEQLTPNLVIEPSDPFYKSLLKQMDSDDRGIILSSLRALGRISVNLEATNKLGDVPAFVLDRISSWLLLNDDELMDACLDFLYQYTAVVSNVDNMLSSITTENLIDHLVRLLAHGARKIQYSQTLIPEQKIPARSEIAPMPSCLLTEMLKLNEPERVHQWVRSFFEEDPESFVTQLAAWQAYQTAFVTPLKAMGQALISPADFIRSSTSVYKDSVAQVVPAGVDTQQKFIIHGMRARPNPVAVDGREYVRCTWVINPNNRQERCGELYLKSEDMLNHVMSTHLGVSKNGDGQYDNVEGEYACLWGECTRFPTPVKMRLQDFARHLTTHICATLPGEDKPVKSKAGTKSWIIPGKTMNLTYEETATVRDENPNMPPQAAGIPLSAVLVLRNIARNAIKTEAQEELVKQQRKGDERGGWNEKLFRPVLPRLFEVLAHNSAMSPYVASLLELIKSGSDDIDLDED